MAEADKGIGGKLQTALLSIITTGVIAVVVQFFVFNGKITALEIKLESVTSQLDRLENQRYAELSARIEAVAREAKTDSKTNQARLEEARVAIARLSK